MRFSTKKIKGRAKKNIFGLITVEKIELENAVNSKLNKTWKKNMIETVGTLQDENWEVKSWRFQL